MKYFYILFGAVFFAFFGSVGDTQAAGNATLQDYWDGKASFVFQYVMPIGIDNGGIVDLGGAWYAFARMVNSATMPSYCSDKGWLQLSVYKSVDKGKTWSSPVVAVDNVPNTPYECANPDSGPYYDVQTNTWHLLFQCLARRGGWNICHATRAGNDPMGQFVVDEVPAIKSGDLWKKICDQQTDDCKVLSPGGVWDEGTPDILKKVNGEYIVSFHGYDGVKGYRGLASTADFVNWKIGNEAVVPLAEDTIFDKKDCANWDRWDAGGCIGGGAADMLEENGFYYMFIEAADKNLGCQSNSKGDFEVLRSNSLVNTNWEQKNTASVYSQFLTGGCNGIAYQKFFKDETGQIYMTFGRYDNGWRQFLLKLEKNNDLAFYQFRESSGDTTRSDLVRFGNYDAKVNNVPWQPTGNFDYKLVFNGQNSYVDFPAHPEFNRNDTVFMEVKAKIDAAPSSNSALLAGKAGSYWAEIYSTALCFWINSEAKGNVNACVPLADLIGQENVYQFLFDGSTLKIGINGTQKASNNIGSSRIISPGNNLLMGGSYPSSTNFYGSFAGAVDYLRLAKTGTINDPILCNPGDISGCKVCNADGSVWTDNNSKCAANQACQNGQCITPCSGWTYLSNIGGVAKYDPAVIAANNKLIIAAAGGDNALWINEFDPANNQNEWYSLDGTLTSGVSLAQTADAKIIASVRGGDNAIWKRIYQSSKHWTNWESIGIASFTAGSDTAAIGQTTYKLVRKSDGSTEIGKCGTTTCAAKTCAILGNYQCGSWGDGCGGNLDCGLCASGKTCNGSGQCVAQSSGGGGGGGGATIATAKEKTKTAAKMTRAEILAKINEIIALINKLKARLAAITGKSVYSCTQITNLYYGMKSDPQVKCLQEVLKAQGYAVAVSGNYDLATKAAVIKFQQKYASEILAPYGLRYGSGNVGNSTKDKLNQIIGEG